jgi:hypothetical protein
MRVSFHINYRLFLSALRRNLQVIDNFRTISKYQSSRKSAKWERSRSTQTGWQTDMTKLIVEFRNFAKVESVWNQLFALCHKTVTGLHEHTHLHTHKEYSADPVFWERHCVYSYYPRRWRHSIFQKYQTIYLVTQNYFLVERSSKYTAVKTSWFYHIFYHIFLKRKLTAYP